MKKTTASKGKLRQTKNRIKTYLRNSYRRSITYRLLKVVLVVVLVVLVVIGVFFLAPVAVAACRYYYKF